MTTRILPREEWPVVLHGTELGSIASIMPDEAIVIVAEDEAGALMGCWSLIRLWQAEGLWIAPEARRSAVVGRHLLSTLKAEVAKLGTHVILSAAKDDDAIVQRMLMHAGAERLPVALYQWPIGREN